MKILYNGSIYETDCDLTINSMINRGGQIVKEEEENKEKDYSDIESRRPRGRRRKVEW